MDHPNVFPESNRIAPAALKQAMADLGHSAPKDIRIDTMLPAIDRLLTEPLVAPGDAVANAVAWTQKFARSGGGAPAPVASLNPAAPATLGLFNTAAPAPAYGGLFSEVTSLGAGAGAGAGADMIGFGNLLNVTTPTAGAAAAYTPPPTAAGFRAEHEGIAAKVFADYDSKTVKKSLPKELSKPVKWKTMLDLDDAAKMNEKDALMDAIRAHLVTLGAEEKDTAANWFAGKLAYASQQLTHCRLRDDMVMEPKCWLAEQVTRFEAACPGFGAKFFAAVFGNITATAPRPPFVEMVPETVNPEPELLEGKKVNPKMESAMQMFGALVRANHAVPGMPNCDAGFDFLERQFAIGAPNGATTAAALVAFLTVAGTALLTADAARFQRVVVATLPGYAAKIRQAGAATNDDDQKKETNLKCEGLLKAEFWKGVDANFNRP